MNDLSEAFQVDEAIKHMAPDKQEAIRHDAELIAGEPQETDEDAAQLIMEAFARPHEDEAVESVFNKIEADEAAEAFALLPPEEQAARKEIAAELLNEAFSQEALEETKQSLAKIAAEEGSDAFREASIYLQQQLGIILENVQEFFNSEESRPFKEQISRYWDIVKAWTGAAQVVSELPLFMEKILTAPEYQDLTSYILDVMAERETQPEYQKMTLPELFEPRQDEACAPLPSLYEEIVEEAKRRRASNLPQVTARRTDLLNYPLDKPNSIIWNLLAAADHDGQLSFEFDTTGKTSRRKGQEAIIYFAANFDKLDGVKLTKTLTQYDKRVCIAAAALINAGNEISTPTQIHYMMGNTKTPSSDQLEKINTSLDKMRATDVYIDTTDEHKVNKGYPQFTYDGSLLPFERITAFVNGSVVDSAIHFFREPPMISFARGRKQITTISRELLESPLNKTDANLAIDDYLIEQISHMKRDPKFKRKMLFATIHSNCQITSAKQQKRSLTTIQRYLDHYQNVGFISGYEMKSDCVIIEI